MPPLNLASSTEALIVGIDLAWGDSSRDGVCLLKATRSQSEVVRVEIKEGDDELLSWLKMHLPAEVPTLLLIDAPLIIKNLTGQRPVEGEVSRLFHREQAGCHSSNLRMPHCKRLIRFAQHLKDAGYVIGHDLKTSAHIVAEIYPHPATIRLFGIDAIIKYKRKKKRTPEFRRAEFKRLQFLIHNCIREKFPELDSSSIAALLQSELSDDVEDQTDAILCALIGYNHWRHGGALSEVVGDTDTGFILLPAPLRFNSAARGSETPS